MLCNILHIFSKDFKDIKSGNKRFHFCVPETSFPPTARIRISQFVVAGGYNNLKNIKRRKSSSIRYVYRVRNCKDRIEFC